MRFFSPCLFVLGVLVAGVPVSLRAVDPEVAVAEGVSQVLPGYRFNKRLATPTADDHILLFSKGRETALVAWTEGVAKEVELPASPMAFSVFNTRGERLGSLSARDFVIRLVLAQEPGIYVPQAENSLLLVAALAETIQSSLTVRGPQTIDLSCTFANPLAQPLILNIPDGRSLALKPGATQEIRQSVDVGRAYEPMRVNVGASGILQTVTISVDNPLLLDLRADLPGSLTAEIVNPANDPFQGRLVLELVGAGEGSALEYPLTISPAETVKAVRVPLNAKLPLPGPVQLSLRQPYGNPRRDRELARTPPMQFAPVAGFDSGPTGLAHWRLARQGAASADLRSGTPPAGVPWEPAPALMLAYQLKEPGALLRVEPASPRSAMISGRPVALGLWLYGDGSGQRVSVRWRDATGALFQPVSRVIDWKGWRYETFAIDPAMQAPIEWDALLVVEAVRPGGGALMASGPVLSYAFDDEQAAAAPRAVEVEDEFSFGDPVKLDPADLVPSALP